MERETQTEEYWRDAYRLTDVDQDRLLEYFMAKAAPATTDALARLLVTERVKAEEEAFAAQRPANAYQPSGSYAVGDELAFAALGGARGEVVAIRDGYNPRYDTFKVISVQLRGENRPREFAAEFSQPHALNADIGGTVEYLSLEELYDRYGHTVRQQLERELPGTGFVRFGGHWLPEALLVSYNEGDLNIADAMVDITTEALPTSELLKELSTAPDVALPIREFSLNYALSRDPRFRNTGTDERPLWHLKRLM